jgi:UDP-N-acetylglucosamine acyltransferase
VNATIHPTAIIHPSAQLGDGVQVGPYAVIEGAAEIADGCIIQAHAVIGGRVVMGPGNLVGYGAVVGGDPQDFAFRPEVQSEVHLGARNRIREYCTIHRGTTDGSATVVGDDCYLMAGAHLAHNCRLGSRVVLANNVLLGGHVVVEDGVFIGGGAVFHQHARVGRLAIAQGRSGFSKDIPPYTIGAEVNMIAGLNVIGLRRAGFSREQRNEIKAAFDLFYRRGLNARQALAAAADRAWGPEAAAFFEFIGTARKGVCALLRSTQAPGGGEAAGD